MIAEVARVRTEVVRQGRLPLLLALCAVMVASLVVQSSAGGGDSHVVIAQGARFAAGLGAMVLLTRVSPARLRIWTPIVFAMTLALLPMVFAFGSGRSARLWINLGFFYLQPGELLKLTVPMMVAWYLHRGAVAAALGHVAGVRGDHWRAGRADRAAAGLRHRHAGGGIGRVHAVPRRHRLVANRFVRRTWHRRAAGRLDS